MGSAFSNRNAPLRQIQKRFSPVTSAESSIQSRTLVATTLWESRDDSDLTEETRLLLKHAASARLDRSNPNRNGRTTLNESSLVPTKEGESPFKAAVQQLMDINRLFWDYTVNFFYVAISCLILLNFCGYGYSFSADDGFQVLPITEFIQERQWKQELNRRTLPSLASTTSMSVTSAAFLSELLDGSSSSSSVA
jgi:hypothetical protein